MLDMYSDFTQHTGQLGVHIEVLEMDDLEARVNAVTALSACAGVMPGFSRPIM